MIHDYRHNKEIYLYRISKYFKIWFNIDVVVNDYHIHSAKLLRFIKQNIKQKKFVIINLNEFYNKCSPLYNSPKLKEGVAHCLLIINQNDYGVEVIDSRCFLNSYFVPNEILIESYEKGIVNSINRFMLLPDLSISHIIMRLLEHAKVKNEIVEETILLKDKQFLRGKKLTSSLLNRLNSNRTEITNIELDQFYTELSEIEVLNRRIAKTLLENENYLYRVASHDI